MQQHCRLSVGSVSVCERDGGTYGRYQYFELDLHHSQLARAHDWLSGRHLAFDRVEEL